MSQFTNIAAYRFAELEDLPTLRTKLKESCRSLGLKGTILLSPEGINVFVAGSLQSVEQLLDLLRAIPGLADLTAKYSQSDEQPFNRMLVKLKKEIIAFGVEGIDPARKTAPKLPPKELKKWLDEGRPVTLLDTRNDYEVKLGSFKGALRAEIDHFREFPDAVRRLPDSLKDEPVIMFCTGGIRCEKAGPFMEREGFRNIFQLDGGILKYFEECGDAHYDGECFVFDQRVGIDGRLRETGSAICFNCQMPLTIEEQRHPHYVPEKSCPHCYQTRSARQKTLVAERQDALSHASHPLPGSGTNPDGRPLIIPPEFDGATLIDFLAATLDSTSSSDWETECDAGRVVDSEFTPLPASHRVAANERCLHLYPRQAEPDINTDIRLIHEDDAIVVLEKPAPLPMRPGGQFRRNTLQYILDTVYRPYRLRPITILDSDATGLCVFAKTRQIAGHLKPQFSHHKITATTLCRLEGKPAKVNAVSDRDGGRIEINPLGNDSTGKGTVLELKTDFVETPVIRQELDNLVSGAGCHPETRMHLSSLEFVHPLTHEKMRFEAKRPDWVG